MAIALPWIGLDHVVKAFAYQGPELQAGSTCNEVPPPPPPTRCIDLTNCHALVGPMNSTGGNACTPFITLSGCTGSCCIQTTKGETVQPLVCVCLDQYVPCVCYCAVVGG
jgi:hypothetical protein